MCTHSALSGMWPPPSLDRGVFPLGPQPRLGLSPARLGGGSGLSIVLAARSSSRAGKRSTSPSPVHTCSGRAPLWTGTAG